MSYRYLIPTAAIVVLLCFASRELQVIAAALIAVGVVPAMRVLRSTAAKDAALSAYRFAAAQLDQKRSHRPSHGADPQPPEAPQG